MVCWVCVTKECEEETSRRLFACLDYTRPTHMTNWTHDLSRTVPRLFLGSQAHLVCAWELSRLCGISSRKLVQTRLCNRCTDVQLHVPERADGSCSTVKTKQVFFVRRQLLLADVQVKADVQVRPSKDHNAEGKIHSFCFKFFG